MNATIITALFNIDRETKGDNRKWSDYLEWFQHTLKLKLPMVIFTSIDLKDFIEEHRPLDYKTKVIIQEDIPYGYLEPDIRAILKNPNYKNTMKDNHRVECILPFYSIIQYSKFKWLRHVVDKNYFDTDYFFWMDAGISRFINVYSNIKEKLEFPKHKLFIQKNEHFDSYQITKDYLWESQCLLCGTIFGGDATVIIEMDFLVEKNLLRWVKHQKFINNEQIMLAILAKERPELFHLVLNDTTNHICLFQKFFIY